MNIKIILLFLVACITSSAEEIIISRIKIQRVDESEMIHGAFLDNDELVYSKDNGKVSLWLSSDNDKGTRVEDKNAIHHYDPYPVPYGFYNFVWSSSKDGAEVRLLSDKVYSLVNSRVGDDWSTVVVEGTEWANQTNTLYCYIDSNYNIYDVSYDYDGSSPSVKVDKSNNLVTFTISPITAFGPPIGEPQSMHCIISNITVTAVEKYEDTVVDVRYSDFKFRDNDGTYSMNGLRNWIKTHHLDQSRWALFPASTDVQLGSNRLKLGTTSFINGSDTVNIYSKGVKMVEVSGGIESSSGWKISGIELEGDNVILYVDAAINQKVTIKRAVNSLSDVYVLVDPSTYSDTYPNTVKYNGVSSYKLIIPMTPNATAEYYTISVTESDGYIGLLSNKFLIGSDRKEYTPVVIEDKNGVKWEVLGRRMN